jgi:hypothetical protein
MRVIVAKRNHSKPYNVQFKFAATVNTKAIQASQVTCATYALSQPNNWHSHATHCKGSQPSALHHVFRTFVSL